MNELKSETEAPMLTAQPLQPPRNRLTLDTTTRLADLRFAWQHFEFVGSTVAGDIEIKAWTPELI